MKLLNGHFSCPFRRGGTLLHAEGWVLDHHNSRANRKVAMPPSASAPPHRIVIISDFQSGEWKDAETRSPDWFRREWIHGRRGPYPQAFCAVHAIEVDGGYLERLPLAAVKVGIANCAEIWTHRRGALDPMETPNTKSPLIRRSFQMNGPEAPFASNDMLGHIEAFGPPAILCVWGLGVNEELMLACRDSFKIYNSIDAPALRVPVDVSRHFDLVLTGAIWQSAEVLLRHPEMRTAVMPIGPEFASELTFRPLNLPKIYDIIYVAAAQPYKRHDVLFEALAKLPFSVRALCVCGYGEMTGLLRQQAAELGINVDFIEPPGVPFSEVNRLMNHARIGVVCGIDDGAPAILTEYMLAGIPVLANDRLTCGLQFITQETGRTASAERFHEGIVDMLSSLESFEPRKKVLENWTWRHSIRRLKSLMQATPPH